ncbi:hypothetical protein [Streptomyces sp. Wh19]|uniref:hypothetical protein n=1 Tax=Streptomyces sp. Wh19 TaxID=3076629 RepID=UPI002958B296|nr:hypothetical protein [Streptomyces sp. Wh19]MDV9195526.1 hypothetical protein [Streptomyces sp. Wh19]
MNHIVAGQSAVTANDACTLCGFWTCRCNSLTGQDALRNIVAELAATAETDVDDEDLAYYQGLLITPTVEIPRATVVLAVAA